MYETHALASGVAPGRCCALRFRRWELLYGSAREIKLRGAGLSSDHPRHGAIANCNGLTHNNEFDLREGPIPPRPVPAARIPAPTPLPRLGAKP